MAAKSDKKNTDKKDSKKPAAKADGAKKEKVTRASFAYDLIKEGKSNVEVLAALKKKFPEDDWEKHSYYPSWYRAHAVKKGLVGKQFAHDHAGEDSLPKGPAKKASDKPKREPSAALLKPLPPRPSPAVRPAE